MDFRACREPTGQRIHAYNRYNPTAFQPCGKQPHAEPQGPGGIWGRSPVEAPRAGAETIESNLLILTLPHFGQTGCDAAATSSSDSRPHSSQAYSYSGMTLTLPSPTGRGFNYLTNDRSGGAVFR
jgi:hypothetical protein